MTVKRVRKTNEPRGNDWRKDMQGATPERLARALLRKRGNKNKKSS